MPLPAMFPFSLWRGDSWRAQFRLWSDAQKTVPVDLTGVSAAAALRTSPSRSSSASRVPLTCSISTNVIDVSLSVAQSQALNAPTAAEWDLQLTYPSGDVQTIVAGPVDIRADVVGSPGVPAAAAQR